MKRTNYNAGKTRAGCSSPRHKQLVRVYTIGNRNENSFTNRNFSDELLTINFTELRANKSFNTASKLPYFVIEWGLLRKMFGLNKLATIRIHKLIYIGKTETTIHY